MPHEHARSFLDAFLREWTSILSENFEAVMADFWHNKPWTARMLGSSGSPDSVLSRVAIEYLSGDSKVTETLHGRYTIDLIGLSGEIGAENIFDKRIGVAIEHENEFDIEWEVWKLAHIQAPLRVLVCYPGGEAIFDEKLQLSANIVNRIERDAVQLSNSEFLLMVAPRTFPGTFAKAERFFEPYIFEDGRFMPLE